MQSGNQTKACNFQLIIENEICRCEFCAKNHNKRPESTRMIVGCALVRKFAYAP